MTLAISCVFSTADHPTSEVLEKTSGALEKVVNCTKQKRRVASVRLQAGEIGFSL